MTRRGRGTFWPERWWGVPDNLRMSPEAKTIFAYLKTGFRNMTGIYTRTIEEITFKTGVEASETRHLITAGAVVGIEYDDKASAVFVVDQFAHNGAFGGNPEWARQAILKDFYRCLGPRGLWLHFAEVYADPISESAVLSDHFERLGAGADPLDLARRLDRAPRRDFDREIQVELTRYLEALPDKKAGAFLEIYQLITKNKDKAARVRFLTKLKEYTPEWVAIKALALIAASHPGRVPTGDQFIETLKNAATGEGGDDG